MPRTTKYPLTPLREHRDRHVGAAAAELGVAVRAREAAESAKHAAEYDRREAELRAETVRCEEAVRLAHGDLRVSDLAHAQAWEYAARIEITALANAVHDADGALAATGEVERAAKEALAQKKAEVDVLAKDEARFDARESRARDAADEEAADEAFAGQRARRA